MLTFSRARAGRTPTASWTRATSLVGATADLLSKKLQDLIETYDLTRFDVPLTYELADTFVLPVKDEVTGLDKYLDPVTDKVEYEALVAEYRDYVVRTSEYQQALAEWNDQMAAAEELYHVPVYLEALHARGGRRCGSIRMPSTPSASRASIRSSPRASPCRCARPAR